MRAIAAPIAVSFAALDLGRIDYHGLEEYSESELAKYTRTITVGQPRLRFIGLAAMELAANVAEIARAAGYSGRDRWYTCIRALELVERLPAVSTALVDRNSERTLLDVANGLIKKKNRTESDDNESEFEDEYEAVEDTITNDFPGFTPFVRCIDNWEFTCLKSSNLVHVILSIEPVRLRSLAVHDVKFDDADHNLSMTLANCVSLETLQLDLSHPFEPQGIELFDESWLDMARALSPSLNSLTPQNHNLDDSFLHLLARLESLEHLQIDLTGRYASRILDFNMDQHAQSLRLSCLAFDSGNLSHTLSFLNELSLSQLRHLSLSSVQPPTRAEGKALLALLRHPSFAHSLRQLTLHLLPNVPTHPASESARSPARWQRAPSQTEPCNIDKLEANIIAQHPSLRLELPRPHGVTRPTGTKKAKKAFCKEKEEAEEILRWGLKQLEQAEANGDVEAVARMVRESLDKTITLRKKLEV